jgi:L-lactate dehydrogenase complex protein LldG
MSRRSEVLDAIGRALPGTRPEITPVDRGYRSSGAGDSDDIELFCERVADYRATVHRTTAGALGALLSEILAGRSVVVPDGFAYDVTGAGRTIVDDDLGPADLDAIDAVVTTATVGIAVTGTVVLDHGPGQGRRALSLVPDLHVCVVRADQIVDDVPEAIGRLDPRRPQTWISGPSATSDIELNRVEGVHGPRTLHVVVLDSGQ